MKIAAISGTHGNVAALDAVLADIAARSIDRVVNLGETVSGGLFPVETADRLMPLALPTIRGNHERQLVTLAPDAMADPIALPSHACAPTSSPGWRGCPISFE